MLKNIKSSPEWLGSRVFNVEPWKEPISEMHNFTLNVMMNGNLFHEPAA